MAIDPNQLPIKSLFEQNHTFEVPPYQRSYAWEDEAIDDFIDDIYRCLAARKAGGKRSHFFGGVVAVRVPVAKSSRTNQEVIDGQQRLASFVMLAAAVICAMETIIQELAASGAKSSGEKKAKKFLEQTVESLRKLYLTYEDNVQLEYVDVPKMTLSKLDNDYFQQTINGTSPSPVRESHGRIARAWTRLCDFVNTQLKNANGPAAKAELLQPLVGSVLAEDCSVIFMPSDSRTEAYQIFQVLNDRGVALTDGDLLRARTLELLEGKKSIQNEVSQHWDSILDRSPRNIDSYLPWYYASLEGKRPKSSNVADQFLNDRFKLTEGKLVTKTEAAQILAEVKRIDLEFGRLATIGDGDWPYDEPGKIDAWDRERLRMLVMSLKHTNAMPLLLSLRLLDAKKFAEAIACIERFVFRYKTIGGGHVTGMADLYHKHSKLIRNNPASFSVGTFRNDLKTLMVTAVPDEVFATNLRATRYSKGQGHGYLRYLFSTLEDHLKWYQSGAQGVPKCTDKTRVFDFANTTLEHIYPQNTEASAKDPALEEVKNTLGNLTLFGPNDNGKVGNKPFANKKPVLTASSLQMNRDIGAFPDWTAVRVKARTELIIKMSLKVFVP